MIQRLRNACAYLFIAPFAVSFFSFVILPFFVALGLAFVKLDLTSHEPVAFVGLKNFQEALSDQYFWKAVWATSYFVVMAVPLTVVLSTAVAVGMHSMTSKRGRHTVRAMLFLPGMVNVAVAAILWQWFYNGEFGLFNHYLQEWGFGGVPWLSSRTITMPAVVLMTLWWSIGGSAILLLAALQQIPNELWEAASLDGAGAWQRLWGISLPLIRPVMLFVTIMTTIGSFQVFGQPYLLTRGGPELATRGVVQYIYETAFNNYRLGYGAAMSWLLFVIIAVFSLVQVRLMWGSRK